MNTVCLVGVFQFLGTFLATGDTVPLIVFLNGLAYHGGCCHMKVPDIITNCILNVWVVTQRPHFLYNLGCSITGGTIFLINTYTINNDWVHVVGVQYVMNLSLLRDAPQYFIPPCILLGTVVAWVLNEHRVFHRCLSVSGGISDYKESDTALCFCKWGGVPRGMQAVEVA